VKAGTSFRAWSSPDLPATRAAEFLPSPLAAESLPGVLAFLAEAAPDDAAFVVVRVGAGDVAALRRAIFAAGKAGLGPRLCLAIDAKQLATIAASAIDTGRVGLMLDDVDADTPLSLIASEAIEALRFRADFVARASRQLRLGCVLEAMLQLSRDLGLCTLGPLVADGEESLPAGPRFDYVPATEAVVRGRAVRRDDAAERATPLNR